MGVLLLTRPELDLGHVRLAVAGPALALGATFQWAAFDDARLREDADDARVRPRRVRLVPTATAVVQVVSFLAVLASSG